MHSVCIVLQNYRIEIFMRNKMKQNYSVRKGCLGKLSRNGYERADRKNAFKSLQVANGTRT